MLEGIGLEQPGLLTGRVGEHRMAQHLGHPAVVAALVRGPGLGQQRLHAVHELHVTPAGLDWFVRVEAGGVSVVVAEVALVDGPDVVADRAVVAMTQVVGPQALGQLDACRDLVRGVAEVGQPHRLVVQPPVEVPLADQVAADRSGSPVGPAVAGEHHVGHLSPPVECLVDVAAPSQRITHQRPPEGQDVVHRPSAVLGHAQRAIVGKVEVHLGRGFRLGGELELDPYSVEH